MLDNSNYPAGTPSKYNPNKYAPLPEYLQWVWLGETARIQWQLQSEVPRQRFLETVDPATGMNALHIAAGRNNLELTRMLIEAGIEIIPDKEGRMPSLIAGICKGSDELADYIAEAESRAPQVQVPEDV